MSEGRENGFDTIKDLTPNISYGKSNDKRSMCDEQYLKVVYKFPDDASFLG